MKAKYILRGFGLGIIITAVVMGAYTKSAVADARVDVLKEYGIGEEAALKETLVDVEKQSSESESETVTVPAVETQTQQEEVQQTDTLYDEALESEIDSILDESEIGREETQGAVSDEDDESVSIAAAQVSEAQEAADGQENTVTIEISRGDVSESVARKLESAGLVESAPEFDAFLKQHGYDRKIHTGVKTISTGASWQEMAETITH